MILPSGFAPFIAAAILLREPDNRSAPLSPSHKYELQILSGNLKRAVCMRGTKHSGHSQKNSSRRLGVVLHCVQQWKSLQVAEELVSTALVISNASNQTNDETASCMMQEYPVVDTSSFRHKLVDQVSLSNILLRCNAIRCMLSDLSPCSISNSSHLNNFHGIAKLREKL